MTAHTAEDIARRLRLGVVPETDNRDALLELGFRRAYPQVKDDYHSRLWSRAVPSDRPSSAGHMQLVIQLAYLSDGRACV